MKKVMVNCGGHNGDSLKRFKELYDTNDEYSYHTFEANPSFFGCYGDFKDHVLWMNAVWTEDCKKKFYISNELRASGKGAYDSTLMEDKAKDHHYLKLDEYMDVDCVDFSWWVKEYLLPDDFNVLKIDIEGAEYDVLGKMIREKTLDYFNFMLIEWHWDKCNIPHRVHIDVINKLPPNLKVLTKWKHVKMF